MVFIQIYRVAQMLANVSINILVKIDERTYAWKLPKKSMYVM